MGTQSQAQGVQRSPLMWAHGGQIPGQCGEARGVRPWAVQKSPPKVGTRGRAPEQFGLPLRGGHAASGPRVGRLRWVCGVRQAIGDTAPTSHPYTSPEPEASLNSGQGKD